MLKTAAYNVDLIQERVRYSPFPFNEKMTVETSLWIYNNQICRELESIARGFDYIVCDRSPLDTFFYAEYFNLKSDLLYLSRSIAEKWLESYEKIFFLRPDLPIVSDGVRSTLEDFRKGVDDIFVREVARLKQNFKQCNLPIRIVELNSSEIIKNDFNFDWIT